MGAHHNANDPGDGSGVNVRASDQLFEVIFTLFHIGGKSVAQLPDEFRQGRIQVRFCRGHDFGQLSFQRFQIFVFKRERDFNLKRGNIKSVWSHKRTLSENLMMHSTSQIELLRSRKLK